MQCLWWLPQRREEENDDELDDYHVALPPQGQPDLQCDLIRNTVVPVHLPFNERLVFVFTV